jgi:membrane associated rhomboid family serine protease
MLPIGDHNPRQRPPVITIVLILINVVVFIYQVLLSERALTALILRAGMVPFDVTQNPGLASGLTLFSSMFLHGGFMHILGNMLYLWVFGDNVEDCLGHIPFLIFYLAAGLAAAWAQIAVDPLSKVPTIGASGAVAGVLGAYLVLYPGRRVRTLVFVLYFIRVIELPAIVVLGFWFVLQIFNGAMALTTATSGGVAWFAHIGGFIAGLLAGFLCKMGKLRPRPRSPYDRWT